MLDEVAAPCAPGFLQRGQRLVDERETAGHALGLHRPSGDDAVPVEQHLGGRRRAHGRVRLGEGEDRPPAGRGRRTGTDRHRGSPAAAVGPGARCASLRAVRRVAAAGQRTHGGERVVGDETVPDQVPERGGEQAVVGGADGVGELPEEERAAAAERGEHLLLERGAVALLEGLQGDRQRVRQVERDPAVVARRGGRCPTTRTSPVAVSSSSIAGE